MDEPESILLVLFVGFLANIVFKFEMFKADKLELDETIDRFYRVIDEDDRRWSIAEENNNRHILDMQMMLDKTLKRIKDNR